MKKRMICLALCLTFGLAFTACSSSSSSSAAASSSASSSSTSSTASSSTDSSSSSTSSSSSASVNYSQGLTDEGFLEGVTAANYVTLPTYIGMEIPQASTEPSESDIESQISTMLANYKSTVQVKDRAVADGDTVNIDYVGSIDGTAFDGGSTNGAGTDVTIGSTQYIDGFLDQVVGHTPGETFTITVTFPADTTNTDLAGKDAQFEITVNYIEETVTPELTDAFVMENLNATYGYSTADEVRAAITANLKKSNLYTYIWETVLLKESTFTEVPENLVQNVMQQVADSAVATAGYYGISIDTYLSYVGYSSVDELKEGYRSQCEDMVKQYMIIQAIAEKENMTVSEDDRTTYFSSSDYTQYTSYYGLGYVNMQVLADKVTTLIINNAKMV